MFAILLQTFFSFSELFSMVNHSEYVFSRNMFELIQGKGISNN